MSVRDEPTFMTAIIGSPHLATTLVTIKYLSSWVLKTFVALQIELYISSTSNPRLNNYC